MKRGGLRLAVLAALWAVPTAGWTAAPEQSLRPEARNVPEAVAEPVDAESDESQAEATEAPDHPDIVLPPPPGMRDQLRVSDAEYAACRGVLDVMGVSYTEAAPIIPEEDRDCGVLRPLEVTEISPGVAITPPAVIRCETAQALALWVHDFVLPAAARMERGALTEIRNGSGYICRRRNGVADGKLSEHAFGNAFDVMGFGFADGSAVEVMPRAAEGSMAEAFQDAVRAAACMEFSTVLGPGSNAAHDDHLHLDIIRRGSGYRLCEQGAGE